jgi:hypothetical protein
MALKDKAARAAYNRAYRERRAAQLSPAEKERLLDHQLLRQKQYRARDRARGVELKRLREPKTLAQWAGALRWEGRRHDSRMKGYEPDGLRGLLLAERIREQLTDSLERVDGELEPCFSDYVEELSGMY